MQLLVLAFFVAFVNDFMWAYYIISTAERRPFASAISSGAIVLLTGTMVMTYLKDSHAVVFAAIGGSLGTFLIVKFKKKP